MSLMMPRRDFPDLAMTFAYRRWRGGRFALASSSLSARMPFIGVLISWLIMARNSDLADVASSAAILATDSSAVRSDTCSSRPATCAAIRSSLALIPLIID